MLVSARGVRLILEACEAEGIDARRLTEPLGLSPDELRAAHRIEWSTLNALLAQLESVGGGDEKIRKIGRHLAHVPASDLIQKIAGSLVSPYALYEFAVNWFSPVTFPGLRTSVVPAGERRIRIHASIAEPHQVARAFFVAAEGSLPELTTLLGLPRAEIVSSRVTERTHDLELELPGPMSVGARLLVGLRAALRPSAALEALEQERDELTRSVDVFMRARDELRNLLERLPNLALVHVAERIVWCNREAARLLGYDDPQSARGVRVDSLLAEDTDDASRAAILRGGPREARFDVALKTRRGLLRVEASAAEDVVFDGLPSKLVVARDLTEQLRLQQRLMAADRLTAVGLLAAGVAHEVNNPLAYVLNNIEIARGEIAEVPSARRSAEALSTALEGVERIRVIVRDLLMLSRGEAGPPRPTDATGVVESTLGLARVEVERTARLERHLQQVPLVLAIESSLAQALLNLVVNALEAMEGRPRETNLLVVRTGFVEGRVLVEVTDNGAGISAEHLPRIFEPFFTTKAAAKGTGLGLPITQQLVTQLGGELRVRSAAGEGATFQILFPPAGA